MMRMSAINDSNKPQDDKEKSSVGKNSKISNDERRLIIELVCDHGKTHDEVSKLLLIKKGTVSSIMRVFKRHNRIEKLIGQGRKPILTNDQEAFIAQFARENNSVSLRKVKDYIMNNPEFNLGGKSISITTIDRILKKHRIESSGCSSQVEKLNYVDVNNGVDDQVYLISNGEENPNEIVEDDAKKTHEIDEEEKEKRVHRQLTNDERRLIIELVTRHNKTHKQVSKLLHIKNGTVSSVLRVYKREHRIEKRIGSGKQSLSSNQNNQITRGCLKQHKNIRFKFNSEKKSISMPVLHRILKKFQRKEYSEEVKSNDEQDSVICVNLSDAYSLDDVETKTNEMKEGHGDRIRRRHCKLTNEQRRLITELIIEHGKTQEEVSQLLHIKKGTVSSVMRVFKSENRIEKRKCKGKRPQLSLEQEAAILQFIQDHRCITLKQVTEQLTNNPEFNLQGKSISLTTIRRIMHRRQVSLRSLRSVTPVLNTAEVIDSREVFAADMLPLLNESSKFIYVDICGFNLDLNSRRRKIENRIVGERATVSTKDSRGGNVSLCAAISVQGMLMSCVKLTPFTTTDFNNFIKTLLQRLNEPSYIIMDDLPFNQTRDVLQEIGCGKHMPKFLPGHSSFLNPLDELFANVRIKSKSRTILNRSDTVQVLGNCLRVTSAEECRELINNSLGFLTACLSRMEISMTYAIIKVAEEENGADEQ